MSDPQAWQVEVVSGGEVVYSHLYATRGKASNCAVELIRDALQDETMPVPFAPTGIDDEFIFVDGDYEVTIWGRQID